METKTTIEEKIKTLILEEIKASAIEACDNPTDDNICNVLNAVEYLKRILKNDTYSSPISAWQLSPSVPKDKMWYDSPIMANNGNTNTNNNKTSDDGNIFNDYL